MERIVSFAEGRELSLSLQYFTRVIITAANVAVNTCLRLMTLGESAATCCRRAIRIFSTDLAIYNGFTSSMLANLCSLTDAITK